MAWLCGRPRPRLFGCTAAFTGHGGQGRTKRPCTRLSMISFTTGNEQDPNPLPPKFKNFASGKISLFTDGPLLFNFLFALHPHKTCNTRGIRHSLLSIFFLNLPCCKTHCNSAQISSGFLLVAKEIFSLLFYKNLVFKNNLFTGYCFFSSAASIHRNQYD